MGLNLAADMIPGDVGESETLRLGWTAAGDGKYLLENLLSGLGNCLRPLDDVETSMSMLSAIR